ncbi:GtrA family protein [Pengzhenrongella frigida]|uniref:GtrA family protein n=1 Tax=Pengzhenrongella frigida TaxID=1259133 RepID=A0A4Q5MW69_9MICO|nr:GtrA family protein [Cellulomonas sp. HLT2-17]RYV49828.1 GtrA family protein [Cellulomonas sp. HLT2-17]
MSTPATGPTPRLLDRTLRVFGARIRLGEIARFWSVGFTAGVIDLSSFNLLRYGPGELLGDSPLTAKVVSVGLSTVVAWLGSRYWTFADRRTDDRRRELVTFTLVNAGGLAVAVSCLAFSHYVLNLTSPVADNISANVIGLILGTIFRYTFYRRVVFVGTPDELLRVAAAAAAMPAVATPAAV